MQDFRNSLASSIAQSMVTDSQKWSAGKRLVCEDVEGKNINKAEKYIKDKHPEVIGQKLQDGTVITPRILTQEIRNSFKNARGPVVNGKNTCKFLLGLTRLYFEDLKDDQANFQRNCAKLDSYLGIINGAHSDEYDQDLNGLSFSELKTRFESAAKQSVQIDRDAVSKGTYVKNDDYEIVTIDSFEDAEQYSQYTSWCVTHYGDMYDNYTHGGLGRFYFCLKKGYRDVERKRGEGCPMDDYGKSMIAISVNDDGSLNTCTCRWNHDNGGNDNMMNTKQISEFFGVNFYETFKPRSVDEIWKKYQESDYRREDDLTKGTGWIKIYGENDSQSGYGYYYLRKEADRIIKYQYVWSNFKDTAFCLATDRLIWVDNRGNEIPPQKFDAMNEIAISIEGNHTITSLRGLPEAMAALHIDSCKNLTDISDLANVKTILKSGIRINGCSGIPEEQVEKVVGNVEVAKGVLRNGSTYVDLSEMKMANGFVNFKVPFDTLKPFWTEDGRGDYVSFETCKKIMSDGVDYDFDYPLDMDNVDSRPFDSIMEENGIRLTWDDISDILNDDYESVVESGNGITEEKCEKISEMLNDDFYDGMSIYTVNCDCAKLGMEAEAQNDIMSAIENVVRTAGTNKFDCWDGVSVEASYPMDLFAKSVHLLWTNDDFFENCNLAYEDGITAFLAARNWNGDDVDKISVVEPQYGWSGYDNDNWKAAIEDFSYRVVKLFTGKDPRFPKEEQR